MAEKIETLSRNRKGPQPKYPWNEWANGSAWRIVRGEDYEVLTPSMARAIYSHAERYGLDVEVKLLLTADALEFRFSTKAAA